MNPNFLNLFMKKLTRDRVVPIMSARASWLILGITVSGLPSLPKRASNSNIRASLFSLELKAGHQILFVSDVPTQQIRHDMSENECSRQTLHKLRLISRIVVEKTIRRTVKKAASKTFSSVRDFFLLHTILDKRYWTLPTA